MGAYGNERTQQSLQDFPVVDSEEEEEKVGYTHNCVNCWILQPTLFRVLFICVGISEGVRPVA